jgi:hypothetical protein
MFAARGGFQYVSIPTTTFGNSALWSSSSNTNFRLSTTSTTDLITWKATSGFTIEYWVYPTAWPGTINPGPGNHDAGATNYWSFGPASTGILEFYYWAPGQVKVSTANTALSLNTWQNVCMVATTSGSNTTISMYVNGVRQQIQVGSGSFADTQTVANGVVATATPFRMGAYGSLRYINLYLDNLRVSNINRYSGASYTLATGPFTSDANTQLLMICDGTNGSTTFTDSSGFARTITNNLNLVTISNARANHS